MSNIKTTDKVQINWDHFTYESFIKLVEKVTKAKETREFAYVDYFINEEYPELESISFTLYNKVEKTKEELEKERIKEKSRIEDAIKWHEKQLENYKNKLDEYNRASE